MGKGQDREIITDQKGIKVVRPAASGRVFRNPGKGWVPYIFHPEKYWRTSAGEELPGFISTVYCNYLTWALLEPIEGEYRWEIMDRIVEHWTSAGRGCKVSFGIHLTDPSSIPGVYHVPEWLVATPGMSGRYYDASEGFGRKGLLKYEPHYYNSVFLEKFGRFMEALKEHYYSTPSWRTGIESFDISTYGLWGEWHSVNFTWSDARTQQETLLRLVDHYAHAFPQDSGTSPEISMNIVSLSSLGGLDNHAVTYAVEEKGANMFRRCIGGPHWLAEDEKDFILAHWPTRKVIGEWGSIDGTLWRFPGGMTTENAVKHALSLHVSQLGWYISGSPLDTERECETGETLTDYFQKRCGYRLRLLQVTFPERWRWGDLVRIEQEWEQTGVAPLYKRYPLRAYVVGSAGDFVLGTDREFDATSWLDGNVYRVISTFRIPAEFPVGDYLLYIALIDPVTEQPAVNLDITGKDIDKDHAYGRYELAWISVEL